MSEIVEADAWHIDIGDLLVEGFGESVWVDRLSTLLAENEVVVLVRGLESKLKLGKC